MPPVVLFVCSNDTHVRTFAPVMGELAALGVESRLLSLDAYYCQGASAAAAELRLAAFPLGTGRPLAAGEFYRRSPITVWRDVLAARPWIASALDQIEPTHVVVGNDFGLIEKLFIAVADRRGLLTILVQDGRLASISRPESRRVASRARRWAKAVASSLFRKVGLGYLAASDYGEGGARLICVTGEAGREVVSPRLRRPAKVIVTGQPRYDRLRALDRSDEGDRVHVVVFTTPFGAVGLDYGAQQRQEAMLKWVANVIADMGGELTVKPHPREPASIYDSIAAVISEPTADPAALLARSHFAVLGLSTLIEEAGLLGCPVVVPGVSVHGYAFRRVLPDADIYPRFETEAAFRRLAHQMMGRETRQRWLRVQSDRVHKEVLFSPDQPAAARVAEAILS